MSSSRGCRATGLTQAALQLVADRLPDAKIRHLREVFSALDRSGCGKLSVEDLKAGLDSHMDVGDMASVVELLPAGLGFEAGWSITYTEFLAAVLDRQQDLQEDACWNAFASFDLDADGTISEGVLMRIGSGGSCRSSTCSSTAPAFGLAGADEDEGEDDEVVCRGRSRRPTSRSLRSQSVKSQNSGRPGASSRAPSLRSESMGSESRIGFEEFMGILRSEGSEAEHRPARRVGRVGTV